MRKTKLWLLLCAAILVVGVIGSTVVLSPQEETTLVEIVQDGTVLQVLDLAAAEHQTIDIVYNGRTNTVQADSNGIRVLHADCPDQNCVHMGYLEPNGLPIVCLPNHLVIQHQSAEQDIDAVAR